MASGHVRKVSVKVAASPRRTTKGPLDLPDPLAIRSSSDNVRLPSPNNATTSPSKGSSPVSLPQQTENQPNEDKDFSFLMDASIYHPLSQLEVPSPFRKPFPMPPIGDTPISKSFAELDSLLSACDFLRAAHLAGSILTSGSVRSNDSKTVFRLLAIRYSCLELSGNLTLAAQESKALEDLSSAFYYEDAILQKPETEAVEPNTPLPRHIMPFALRLQALRLQSVGFSDPRRGVSALYEIGIECREHIASLLTSDEDAEIWSARLEEVGIHVINALIEMGEYDCARRTLGNTVPSKTNNLVSWKFRVCLLHLKMGLISEARDLIEKDNALPQHDKSLLRSLLEIADGRYEDAEKTLSTIVTETNWDLVALAKQNLAVTYLYMGNVQKSKILLDSLIDDNHSFQSLTINLATIYDLTSDRSRDLKISLTGRIEQQEPKYRSRSFTNQDFKL